MKISLVHATELEYDTEVVESVMDTRVGPMTDQHQRWDRHEVSAKPAAAVRRYADGNGNAAHLVTLARPHRSLRLIMRGEVETLLEDPFASTPAGRLTALERLDHVSASLLVPRHPGLDALASPHRPAGDVGAFESVQRLMHLVHEGFAYRPETTTVFTTATEMLTVGGGVCQDFAHLLIGLCRAIDIPARYVSGYIVTGERRQEPHRGGGASHAWAEAYTTTHGWRGFDATNGLVAADRHVKMAIGRDYSDVPPTRGTYRGIAREAIRVQVVARVAH